MFDTYRYGPVVGVSFRDLMGNEIPIRYTEDPITIIIPYTNTNSEFAVFADFVTKIDTKVEYNSFFYVFDVKI